jgi:hypothetical protein
MASKALTEEEMKEIGDYQEARDKNLKIVNIFLKDLLDAGHIDNEDNDLILYLLEEIDGDCLQNMTETPSMFFDWVNHIVTSFNEDVATTETPCRHDRFCQRPDCWFSHTNGRFIDEKCSFGNQCKRKGCLRIHK